MATFNTGDEIEFIKRLGMNRDAAARQRLLTKYAEAVNHRTDWGPISKHRVLEFINQTISAIR